MNVFTPGGLHAVEVLQGAAFIESPSQSLERKIEHKTTNGGSVHGTTLATL